MHSDEPKPGVTTLKSRPFGMMGSLRTFIVVWTTVVSVAIKVIFWLIGLNAWTGFDGAFVAHAFEVTLISIGVWVLVSIGFSSMIRLGDILSKRRPSDLAPIDGRHFSEVTRLIVAINALIAAQQDSIHRQRRFLADASHQLRTPFAVLKTQIQGLMSGQLESKATLPKMLATVDKSSDLLRQLLAIEKVEQLRRAENWVPVDIESVAQEVAIEMSPIVARKHLDLSLEATQVVLATDPWLLTELIKNLLSNAIHHSQKGSALGILIRELPSAYELIVWDNGGGVNAEVQARLFEPFVTASGAKGVGLGLSICKQIAVSMNAEIGLYNRIGEDGVVGVDAVVRWPKNRALQPSTEEENTLKEYLHGKKEFDANFWKDIGRTAANGAVNPNE